MGAGHVPQGPQGASPFFSTPLSHLPPLPLPQPSTAKLLLLLSRNVLRQDRLVEQAAAAQDWLEREAAELQRQRTWLEKNRVSSGWMTQSCRFRALLTHRHRSERTRKRSTRTSATRSDFESKFCSRFEAYCSMSLTLCPPCLPRLGCSPQRIARIKETAPSKYVALESKLRKDPRLARFL